GPRDREAHPGGGAAADRGPACEPEVQASVSTPTTSRTASAEAASADCSSSVSSSSMISSTPPVPSLTGTPMYRPSIPYSPSSSAVQGSTRFWSSRIESTICATAAPGAYQADVPSRFTTSPPPLRVRSTIASIRSAETSCDSGTPPTVVADTTGTIWSPWPPSTTACTSL